MKRADAEAIKNAFKDIKYCRDLYEIGGDTMRILWDPFGYNEFTVNWCNPTNFLEEEMNILHRNIMGAILAYADALEERIKSFGVEIE